MHFILVPLNISQLTGNVNDFLKVIVSLPRKQRPYVDRQDNQEYDEGREEKRRDKQTQTIIMENR